MRGPLRVAAVTELAAATITAAVAAAIATAAIPGGRGSAFTTRLSTPLALTTAAATPTPTPTLAQRLPIGAEHEGGVGTWRPLLLRLLLLLRSVAVTAHLEERDGRGISVRRPTGSDHRWPARAGRSVRCAIAAPAPTPASTTLAGSSAALGTLLRLLRGTRCTTAATATTAIEVPRAAVEVATATTLPSITSTR